MFKIRNFNPKDADRCEQILLLNDQLPCPEIDGKEAMKRVYKRQGRYFLVAEENGFVIGLTRGTYDGSRALLWELSVDPNYQSKGVGKGLMKELLTKFKEDGAPTVSVTSLEKSREYYVKHGFEELPIKFMLANIDKVMKKL